MPASGDSVPSDTRPRDGFEYALIRVVPRVERGERVNVGVILFCRDQGFLGARLEPDERRLLALDPDLDLDAVRRHLEFIRLVCAGDRSCGAVAQLTPAERFHWLASPASTIVQPSRIHTGICADPSETLDRLVASLVRLPG